MPASSPSRAAFQLSRHGLHVDVPTGPLHLFPTSRASFCFAAGRSNARGDALGLVSDPQACICAGGSRRRD